MINTRARFVFAATLIAMSPLAPACGPGGGSGSGTSTGSSGGTVQGDARAPSELDCPVGTGDCNGDPADGCETSLMFDADNCGRCGRHCDDGECRQFTCAGVKLSDPSTSPAILKGPFVVSGDRLFFRGRAAATGTSGIWSIDKTGADARLETDLATTSFQVVGDTILAVVMGASGRELVVIDRRTSAVTKTYAPDVNKNECLGEQLHLAGSEAVTFCYLPARSFNKSQNAILAIDAAGTFRTVYRAACEGYEPCWDQLAGGHGFVADGLAGWDLGSSGQSTLRLVDVRRPDPTTTADHSYTEIVVGANPGIAGATGTFAFSRKYFVYEANDQVKLIAPGLGTFTGAPLRGLERTKAPSGSGPSLPWFELEALAHAASYSWLSRLLQVGGIIGIDDGASYYTACALTDTRACAPDGPSLIIVPWRRLTPPSEVAGRESLRGTAYFTSGGGAPAIQVAADDRFVFWTGSGGTPDSGLTGVSEGDNSNGLTLWRAPR